MTSTAVITPTTNSTIPLLRLLAGLLVALCAPWRLANGLLARAADWRFPAQLRLRLVLTRFRRRGLALANAGESDETVAARLKILEDFARDPVRTLQRLARAFRGHRRFGKAAQFAPPDRSPRATALARSQTDDAARDGDLDSS